MHARTCVHRFVYMYIFLCVGRVACMQDCVYVGLNLCVACHIPRGCPSPAKALALLLKAAAFQNPERRGGRKEGGHASKRDKMSERVRK